MGCILVDSEVIPLDLSALIIPIIFSTLNLISWKDALRSFMDPINMDFYGRICTCKGISNLAFG